MCNYEAAGCPRNYTSADASFLEVRYICTLCRKHLAVFKEKCCSQLYSVVVSLEDNKMVLIFPFQDSSTIQEYGLYCMPEVKLLLGFLETLNIFSLFTGGKGWRLLPKQPISSPLKIWLWPASSRISKPIDLCWLSLCYQDGEREVYEVSCIDCISHYVIFPICHLRKMLTILLHLLNYFSKIIYVNH